MKKLHLPVNGNSAEDHKYRNDKLENNQSFPDDINRRMGGFFPFQGRDRIEVGHKPGGVKSG